MSERLRIALTKGRLQDKSVELFEAMGLDCSPVRNPGRRLIHSLPNYPLDAVLAKAPDVITYVEHGVCDLGVVGKDTILEKGGAFYEVLDLTGAGKAAAGAGEPGHHRPCAEHGLDARPAGGNHPGSACPRRPCAGEEGGHGQ